MRPSSGTQHWLHSKARLPGGTRGSLVKLHQSPPELFGGKNRLHFEAGREPYLLLPIIP
jgi:hypothetical protein